MIDPDAPLAGVQTVFFDIDDTLYDYRGNVARSLTRIRAMDEATFGRFDDAAFVELYWDSYARVPDDLKLELIFKDLVAYRRVLWREILAAVGVEASDERANELGDAWARIHYGTLAPFPGAIETARALKDAGVRVGVITNGPSPLQRAKLAGLNFDTISEPGLVFVSGEVGYPKPAREIFDAAHAATGHDASLSLMVGNDVDTDLYAKAIGFRTAHFTPCTRGDLNGHPWPPDASVATYGELARLLGLE